MKKLSRIKGNDSMLGGVMAGFAEYWDVDVTLLRVIAAAGFFTPAPVVIVYIILWAIMPAKDNYSIVSNNS